MLVDLAHPVQGRGENFSVFKNGPVLDNHTGRPVRLLVNTEFAAQKKQLTTTLKGVVGKDVALEVTEDPSLLGGMVVKIGSRQIDTSLRTKLSSMKLALKEVG